MAKFDVFLNPNGDGLLLDVQTDLLSGLNTRVVVPLLARSDAPKPATRLNPVFDIDGEQFVIVTQFLAAVPEGVLKSHIGDVTSKSDQITAAIDMLTQGF